MAVVVVYYDAEGANLMFVRYVGCLDHNCNDDQDRIDVKKQDAWVSIPLAPKEIAVDVDAEDHG